MGVGTVFCSWYIYQLQYSTSARIMMTKIYIAGNRYINQLQQNLFQCCRYRTSMLLVILYSFFFAEPCNLILKAIKILPFSSIKKITNLDREVFFSHHISYLFLCSQNNRFNFKPAIRPTDSLNQTTKLSLLVFLLPFLSFYLFIILFF